MPDEIRVVQVGLRPLGKRIVKHIVSERQGIKYVGAIDISPEISGKDLGEVAEVGRKLGTKITNQPEKVFQETKPDITIYTTTSLSRMSSLKLNQPVRRLRGIAEANSVQDSSLSLRNKLTISRINMGLLRFAGNEK